MLEGLPQNQPGVELGAGDGRTEDRGIVRRVVDRSRRGPGSEIDSGSGREFEVGFLAHLHPIHHSSYPRMMMN